jgi:hypothetical protein
MLLAAHRLINAHFVFLSDAVNPADALFDLHGVPGQVIVDHLVAKLQVASLTADFRGDQNIGLFP